VIHDFLIRRSNESDSVQPTIDTVDDARLTTMRLLLATYNIHRCTGLDGRHDPDRVLGVLRELDADVIALQEVDSHEHKGLELLKWISQETKLTAIPGPTLLRQNGHYGNALLTRHYPMEVRHVDLSLPRREPRGAIDADLACNGETLQVIATHLGLTPAERRMQVQRLLQRFGTKHCVLMGDLNEWFLWGRPLRWINAIFGGSPAPATFPSIWPIFALDRIWIRPPGTLVDLKVHKSPLARRASDHLPITATIEW
jgi:endonuclease/exonuclease/phosphatase family metal-dependent hydrolase